MANGDGGTLGCTTVLLLAVLFHAWRGEVIGLIVNLPLLAVAAFLLWGRWRRAPIEPRSGDSR